MDQLTATRSFLTGLRERLEAIRSPQARMAIRRYLPQAVLGAFLAVAILCLVLHWDTARKVDQRLSRGAFSHTFNFYAAPAAIPSGVAYSREALLATLERSGYSPTESKTGRRYTAKGNTVEIQHGEAGSGCTLQLSKDKITQIVRLGDGSAQSSCVLAPSLVANLSERSREKRTPVKYSELPDNLVKAVLAIEDKRFFKHSGVDFLRAAKAAYVDLKEGSKAEGASTLTMQVVRSLWLNPEKSWARKLHEIVIAMHLEERLSKEEIFELYANEIYLGRDGTFSVHGFGEGARAFFGRDIRDLALHEAATLAGLARAPSYYNPFRYPKRVQQRRNLVLQLMRDNGFIDEQRARDATAAPLTLKHDVTHSLDAPYVADMIQDEVQNALGEQTDSYDVYTTIDVELQRLAENSLNQGLESLHKQLRKSKKTPDALPQAALVALDPHTGDIKALVGGKSYTESQLNRALAQRQPGSTFKPFVYAAALNTALEGRADTFTPATIVDDEPSTFRYGDEVYEPGNFKGAVYGPLTMRRALAQSVNIATVKVAETVGYARVARLARSAGLNTAVLGTPSIALGSYDTTPLELAGAYTVFANGGTAVKPRLVTTVRRPDGSVVHSRNIESRAVLDPRVTYLIVNMMEEVMNSGTGAGVRGRGFYLPAAGKTGTSRDGWFVGFTSGLLCLVWVGYDDHRDLNMEGSKSALPIWADFMKRAHALPAYRNAQPFRIPSGIVSATIDSETGLTAGPSCWDTRTEYFLPGTVPGECSHDTPAFKEGEMPRRTVGGYLPRRTQQ